MLLLAHVEHGDGVKWVLPGLTYADDVLLMVASVCDMLQLLDICTKEATELGLKFNTSKFAALVFVGPHDTTLGTLRLGGNSVPVFHSYKYLGITLSNTEDYLQMNRAQLSQHPPKTQLVV